MSNTVLLGEIASLKTGPFGTQLSASEYVKDGIPVINVRNIGYGEIITSDLEYVGKETAKRLYEHLLHKGDIVFGRKGSVDRHAFIDTRYDGWMQGSDCIRVRINEGINPHFISHNLKLESVKKQINSSAVGSTMASLNTDILSRIQIVLPSLEIQNRIEELLSVIEEKIDLNTRLCAKLEAMAKTLYDYWFVQFDFPDENGKPYRTSGGAMEKCKELGREVPKGWKAGTVVDLGEIVSGATPSTTEENYYTTNGIAWITPNDLSDNEHNMFVFHGERDITEAGLSSCSAILMPAGSVLMSSRAPIGYLAIAANPVCTNQGFKSIICTKDYGTLFVYYTLKRNVQGIARQGVGTTFKEVSRDTLARYTVLLPDTTIAKHFEQLIAPISQTRKNCEQENRELIALRDWLLPMLMNGQAKVE